MKLPIVWSVFALEYDPANTTILAEEKAGLDGLIEYENSAFFILDFAQKNPKNAACNNCLRQRCAYFSHSKFIIQPQLDGKCD